MLSHRIPLRIIAILLVFFSTPLRAGDVLPKEEVDRFVKPIIDGQYAKCLVVGLINEHDRQVIGYGIKSDTDRTPPDGQSVFEIGSVTKTFTATLLAEAVLRGEVKLDDPVQKFMPGDVKIPRGKDGKEVTLLNLTTHSSGLARMPSNFAPADPGNPYADYSAAQMYAYLSEAALLWEPGEKCNYSNLGVGLLGHALALHAKQPYEELLLERICKPLKMKSTRVTLDDSMRARLAPAYDVEGNPLKNWDLNVLGGAGGIRSTADDMLTYVAAETGLARSELSPAIELTHKRQREFAKGTNIALGWMITQKDGIYNHGGQTGGYHTGVYFDPVHKLGVIILATTNSGLPDAAAARLMHRLLGQKAEPPTVRQAIALDEKVLERYVGKYQLGLLSYLTVEKSAGKLKAQLTGQPAFRIYPESETKFFWKVVDANVTFDVDVAGKVTGLVLHQNGKDMKAERMK
jgi:CubicO group peptidase (beta-lactamase class C family)